MVEWKRDNGKGEWEGGRERKQREGGKERGRSYIREGGRGKR